MKIGEDISQQEVVERIRELFRKKDKDAGWRRGTTEKRFVAKCDSRPTTLEEWVSRQSESNPYIIGAAFTWPYDKFDDHWKETVDEWKQIVEEIEENGPRGPSPDCSKQEVFDELEELKRSVEDD